MFDSIANFQSIPKGTPKRIERHKRILYCILENCSLKNSNHTPL